MKKILTMVATGLLVASLTACSAETGDGGAAPAEPAGETPTAPADEEGACEACAKGKAGEDVFCAECKAGYVGGDNVTACAGCFAAKTGGPDCPD